MGKSKTKLLFGAVFVALVVLAWMSYRETQDMATNDNWVAHTHEVLDVSAGLQMHLGNAVAARRGYVLYGDEKLARRFESESRDARDYLNHLKSLAGDDAQRTEGLKQVEKLLLARIDAMRESIEARRTKREDEEAQERYRLQSAEMENQLNEALLRFEQRERSMLVNRVAEASKNVQVSNRLNITILVSMFGILLVALWLQRRERVARDRAERALAGSESLIESVFNSVSDEILVGDKTGRIVMRNAAAVERHPDPSRSGPPPEEHPEHYGLYRADGKTLMPVEELPLVRACQGETIENMELYICPKGKEEGRWVLASGLPLRDAEGELQGGVIVLRNYTAQKVAQEDLRLNQKRLAEAQRIAHMGNWDWNLLTGKLHWSEETFRILGWKPGEIIPKYEAFLELIIPGDRERLQEEVQEAIAGRKPYDIQFEICRPDGTRRVLHVRGKVERDGSDRPERMSGSIQDVTEEKRGEEERRLAHARLKHVMESIADPFVTLDNEFRYVYINDAGEAQLRARRDEILGKTVWEAFPDLQGTILEQGLRRAAGEKVPVRFDFYYPPFDMWNAIHIYPSSEGMSVFFADISERKEMERRERVRREQLRRLSELSLKLSGDPADIFEHVTRMIGELFEVRVVCLSEVSGNELIFRAVHVGGKTFRDAGQCPLSVTPCANVEREKDIHVFDYVAERFPEASFLKQHNAFSYCGFPALGSNGEVLAITCLLDDKPHEFTEEDQKLLRIIGQRIATEMERARSIARRRQAEEASRQAEELLLQIGANLPELLWVRDAEAKTLLYANPGWERYLGHKPVLGGEYSQIIPSVHPDELEMAREAAKKYPEGGFDALERLIDRENHVHWYHMRTYPIRDAEGKVHRVVGIGEDVTKRLESEKALRESEQMFWEVGTNLPELLWVREATEKSTALLYCNPAWERVLGYRPQVGSDYREMFKCMHPDDLPMVEEISARNAPGNFDEVVRLVNPQGAIRWFHMRLFPILDRNGDVYRVAGIGEDITEQKKAEEALRASEERYALVEGAVNDGIWDWNVLTHEDYLSPRWKQILGYRDDELPNVDSSFFELVHPDDKARVEEAVRRHIEERKPYHLEIRLRHKDGSYRWILSRGEALRDDEGRPVRMIGTITDYTEKHEAEERLAASLREKEILLREVHHRVKNNLQIISSLLYFQSKKMKNMEDVLVFQEGQERLRSMIMVHETLHRSGDLAQIDFAEHVKALATTLRQNSTLTPGKIDIEVDAQDISLAMEVALPCGMIVNELLTNAYKHAFPDGRGGLVLVKARRAGEKLKISVADTGKGLPKEFNPEKSGSFGMQLIRGLVTQLSGTIEISSRRGTSVLLEIPLPVRAGPAKEMAPAD